MDKKKHNAKVTINTTILAVDPVNIIVAPNKITKAIASGTGRYLLGLITERIGKGRRSIINATVENVEPVGVKFKALAKSNGRNTWKKAESVSIATRIALT